MSGDGPHRAPGGRHTLGSLPESQEPRDPAALIELPNLPAGDHPADGAEPLYTIYGRAWYAARERAQAMDGEVGRRLVDLLVLVENGWLAVRELQHWVESDRPRAAQKDAYGHLLAFIDSDLVDLFREVAAGVAALVPGWEGWETESDPDGVAGDVECFVRYLAVLKLAVRSAAAPQPFAELVASVCDRLRGWGDEVAALVATCSDAIFPT